MPGIPEGSLPQNPIQEEVISARPICVQEYGHYTRSNLQLLYILHSLFQGRSSVPMPIAAEGAVHTTHDEAHITSNKTEEGD